MQNTETADNEDISLNPEDYMTVAECAAVCHFKGSDPIRRAIRRGELRAYNMRFHQLLVLRRDFKRWFANRLVTPDMKPVGPHRSNLKQRKKEPEVPFKDNTGGSKAK